MNAPRLFRRTAGDGSRSAVRTAVVLDGARRDRDPTSSVADLVASLLLDRRVETETYELRILEMAYCVGCFECWTRTPGLCRTTGDAGHELARAIIQSDLAVFVSPITFGGYSSEIKKVLDRSICLISPFFRRIDGEVHHRRRYGAYPRILAVGVQEDRNPDEEWIFRRLVERNALNIGNTTHGTSVLQASQDPASMRDRLVPLLDMLVAESAA
jgi:multimeric flavodoxin WrbA